MTKSTIAFCAAFAALCLSKSALSQEMEGRFGLSIQSGLLLASNLYIYDLLYDLWGDPDSEGGLGIPIDGGFCYFISEDLMAGTDVAFTWMPGMNLLGGPTRSWSLLEFRAYLRYFFNSTSRTRPYGKVGVKLARLKGSERPGTSFLGGTSGHHIDTRTSFEPGVDLALGLMRMHRSAAVFGEVSYGYLLTEEADVRAFYDVGGSEANPGKYPFDLKLFGVKVGIINYFD